MKNAKQLDDIKIRGATFRQRKAAKLVAEAVRLGKNTTKGEIVKQAGYAESVSLLPTKVTESKGFLLALAELGLTKDLVVSALQEDIKAKPGKRAFELSIAGKWLGLEQKGEAPHSGTNIERAVIIIQAPSKAIE
jgi:hypothetical protein